MSEMPSLEETFGCNVFNDAVMRASLPKNIYKLAEENY